jgi:cAMP-dependent protein kinase regulator
MASSQNHYQYSVQSHAPDPTDLDPLISALRARYAVSSTPNTDPLQFCADFFHQRLASDRADLLLARQPTYQSLASSIHSPHSNFHSGMNTGAIHSVAEEDEHALNSPLSSNFPDSALRDTHQQAPPSSNKMASTSDSPFGNFGGFNSATSGAPSAHDEAPLPSNYNLHRRTSVSAESLTPTNASQDNWTPPFHTKTPDQLDRLRKAVSTNFLFAHLAEEQSTQVLGALQERSIPKADIRVIVQGDVGDYFYVVENGCFHIYVNPSGKCEPGPDGMGNKVTTVGPGGSFGELALMYNAPRAATVVSAEPSTLWALDRVTFRRILMDAAFQRRRMYENFLSEVPLLQTLLPYERSKIADALETVKYTAGEHIIEEGEVGENFFILEEGQAEVYRNDTQGCVKTYNKGDYFGELALLNDAPRAASVIAKTDCKVARLGKDGFARLLGSLEGIMRRNDYSASNVDPHHRG